ncbi:hypothetical protein V8C86DRAFT_2907567 [Haematococcus lacustris]
MAWLVRVVLAATTSAGSRLPAPGCPMGLGGGRQGCGLVVVVGQQRDGGRGQGAGGQLVTPAAPLITIRLIFKIFSAILVQGCAAHEREASGLLGLMCTCAGAGGGVENSGRIVPGMACLVGLWSENSYRAQRPSFSNV